MVNPDTLLYKIFNIVFITVIIDFINKIFMIIYSIYEYIS